MNPDDRLPFFELMDVTYDLIGKTAAAKVISPAAKAMFFEDLMRYPLDLIRAALSAHRTDPAVGQYTPSPAHIIAQIEKRRRVAWLSADEAWAQVPKIEGQPGILNDVTAQALAVAGPLLAEGDDTAARMAFKGCYTRLVDLAKLDRRGPKYFLSPGGSYDEQQAVLAEGVRQGLLPAPVVEAAPQLEAPRTHGAKPDLKALLATLTPKIMIPMERQDYE